MNKAIEYQIGGIKCDNPKCDYINLSVAYEDYPNWVNKSCPKCGANLLTEKDYKACLRIMNIVNKLNKILPAPTHLKSDDLTTATFHFDGSGKVNIDIEK